MKNAPSIGDFVKSSYRSPWLGVIYRIEKTKDNCICEILVLKDRRGNLPRKVIRKRLGIGWLEKIKPFDTSHVNPDWLGGSLIHRLKNK